MCRGGPLDAWNEGSHEYKHGWSKTARFKKFQNSLSHRWMNEWLSNQIAQVVADDQLIY